MRYFLPVIALAVLVSFWVATSEATIVPGNLNTNAAADNGHDKDVSLASDDSGLVIAAWESTDDLGGTVESDSDIFFARSFDHGATWGDPQVLTATMAADDGTDEFVDIATDNQGNWVVTWASNEGTDSVVDYDIFASRSLGSNGSSWSSPVVVNHTSGGSCCSGLDSAPSLVFDEQSEQWIVAWHSSANIDGLPGASDLEILVSRSDDGSAWSDLEVVNNDYLTEDDCLYGCRDESPDLAVANGTLVATWRKDPHGHGYDNLVARSTDAGSTWTDPLNLTNKEGAVGVPDIVTDGDGNWMIVWEQHNGASAQNGGNKNIYMAKSSDDGLTWSSPAVINGNASADTLNDHAPRIAVDASGNWRVVWWQASSGLDGQVLLVTESSDFGSAWSYPASIDGSEGSRVSIPDAFGDLNATANGWLLAWHHWQSPDFDLRFTTCLPGDAGTWQVSPGDGDCDGWHSSLESSVGTSDNVACGFTPGGDVASENWPPDLVESNNINISDVLAMKPVFGSSSERHDLVPSGGTITISDVLALKPFFGASCTP